MAHSHPSGTVTFLLTDLEGSTKLWEQYPKEMKVALARHDEILRRAIEDCGGYIIKTTGDGVHAAFDTALNGTAAALAAQTALLADKWEEIQPHGLRIRIGLHTGEAEEREGDYYGPTLNRTARLMSIGHGGQTLLSATTAELVRDQLASNVSIRDLGEHRLKDLVRSEHVFQLSHTRLPSDFPPLKSIDTFPNNLPVQLTTFIGREREIEEAKQRLSSARLLTLIGPGGTGKTRLALQLAADVLPNFSDGVWMAELAPLADPALVVQTVGSVFGLREQLGMPLSELLMDYLRAKNILLLIDNCEHLVESCALLIEQLLHACPNLKIIASSREALGIAGETVYRVPPLSLPDPTQVTHEALAQSESVQLFIVRAAAANPQFTFSDQNAASVAQICRRLDGIPLALELAAARVTVFSAEQIASHLDDRFKLLTGGSRTALPRHQTLRALIDWSYDLLPDDERSLLRKLSVFAGGWTYEAAEAVCSELDVLNLLGQLVNKSLVAMDDEGSEPRYRLLETVRQYTRDKLLEMGESEQARIAHFDFFFKLAKTAEPMLESTDALEWIQRLEREYDNIRAALGWGIDNNVGAVLRMVPSLAYFWNRRGYEEEGRHLIREALSRSDKLPIPEGESGRRTKSAKAEAWQTLAMLAYSQGDNARAIEASDQAASLAREVDDKRLLALTLAFKASGRMFLGITDGVEAILEEALAAARESGDIFAMGLPLSMYGQASAMLKSDSKITREYAKEGAIMMQEAGNRWGAMMALMSMAMIDKFSGNYSEARAKFAACEPRIRELGDRHRLNMVKSELAHIDRYEGHYQQAETVYRETIREWQRLGHRAAVAHQLECLASIAKVQEQGRRAATLFGAAQALREKIGISMTPFEKVEYDREIADLRRGLDQGVFDSSWAAGRAMSMDQAIAFVLEAKPNTAK